MAGSGRVAVTDYESITGTSVHQHADRNLDGDYAVWDRFGRVKQSYWRLSAGAGTYKDQIRYGYDYARNRTYCDIDSGVYATDDQDQVYTYDGLHRLKTYDEGTLSGSTISGTPGAIASDVCARF